MILSVEHDILEHDITFKRSGSMPLIFGTGTGGKISIFSLEKINEGFLIDSGPV